MLGCQSLFLNRVQVGSVIWGIVVSKYLFYFKVMEPIRHFRQESLSLLSFSKRAVRPSRFKSGIDLYIDSHIDIQNGLDYFTSFELRGKNCNSIWIAVSLIY